MRLLWITEHYYPNRGGMAQSCDRIVNGLREQGIAVDLVHLAKKCRRPPAGNPALGEDFCWPLGENPAHGLNLLWNWIENRSCNYSGVVAFGAHHALIAAKNYAAWLEIALVVLVRGNDFDTAVFDYRRSYLIEQVYRCAAKVICVSQDKVTKINKLYPGVNTAWVCNGIDLYQWRVLPSLRQQAQALKIRLPSGRRVIGLIGELKTKKGAAFFLETLLLSGLAETFHLLFIGELEPELAQQLEGEQTNLSNNLSVSHIPFLERHQLVPYYLACDCLAIPSFYDGTPNVLLEAGALGVPILAANTGGMKDILAHGQNALLFPPGDTHSLRELLNLVAHIEHGELTMLAKRFQTDIANHYTHQHEAQAYAAIFRELDEIV